MRKIKFRGITINGQFAFGLLSESTGCKGQPPAGLYISNNRGMPWAFAVRTETVGQYTGIKDKNGVEIYEGDIIEFIGIGRLAVEFKNEYVGGWVLTHKSVDGHISLGARSAEEIEVIGNIYEAPELATGFNYNIQTNDS